MFEGPMRVPSLQADWWPGCPPRLLRSSQALTAVIARCSPRENVQKCPEDQKPNHQKSEIIGLGTRCVTLCQLPCRFIMENGAKGVEVIISGKLRAQRAKVTLEERCVWRNPGAIHEESMIEGSALFLLFLRNHV